MLKPGGILGFTSMKAGSPMAGQIFRECAARHGVRLQDPSAPLGSEAACRSILLNHGFDPVLVVCEAISFSSGDLSLAWESNFRSPAHAPVHQLAPADIDVLKADFLDALAHVVAQQPEEATSAQILYAVGRRQ